MADDHNSFSTVFCGRKSFRPEPQLVAEPRVILIQFVGVGKVDLCSIAAQLVEFPARDKQALPFDRAPNMDPVV